MAADFSVPMAGSMPVTWSMGEDEDGQVVGFLGTPKERVGEEDDELLAQNIGSTIGFSRGIRSMSDDHMAQALLLVLDHAWVTHLRPRIYKQLYPACIEQRDRSGGYDPSLLKDEPAEG